MTGGFYLHKPVVDIAGNVSILIGRVAASATVSEPTTLGFLFCYKISYVSLLYTSDIFMCKITKPKFRDASMLRRDN